MGRSPVPLPPYCMLTHPNRASYCTRMLASNARAYFFLTVSSCALTHFPATAKPTTTPGLRAHGLLPVLVRELTEPTLYGPDGDEGDGRNADLEEKLIRCVRRFDYVCMFVSLNCWACRLLHTYVSGHGGTFDAPEKKSLRTFLDDRRGMPGEGELGLGTDELRELENALT